MENLPAIVTASLSSLLTETCKTPSRWVSKDDGYGGEMVPGKWMPPDYVSAELKRDAIAACAKLEPQCARAPTPDVRKWLASLGLLCAGSTAAEDAKAKILAYAGLLEFPGACYTKDSLRSAAERFKWLPSYAELHAFLSEIAAPLEEMFRRVGVVSRMPLRQPRAPQEPPHKQVKRSPEEMAIIDAENDKRIAQLRAAAKEAKAERYGPVRSSYLRNGPFQGQPPNPKAAWGPIPGTNHAAFPNPPRGEEISGRIRR